VPDVDLGGTAPEREMLIGFLDWYRAVVENKVRGLSRDDAARVMTPSGLSPLGVVQHLAWVERGWFREHFAGEDLTFPGTDEDSDFDFRIEPGATTQSVLDFYRTECAHSRRVTGSASLDVLSARESPHRGRVSMRWILVHMLEETARHAGHLDLMREQIDGVTGD
jgi:Protein of unknown function (DUF664)